jgi:hypothetical protein
MKYKQILRIEIVKIVVVAICVLVNTKVAVAEVFVAPFGGYSFGSSALSAIDENGVEQSSVNFAESNHWGVMAGVTTPDPGSIYLLYSHQPSQLKVTSNLNQDVISSLDVDYLHIGGALYFPKGNFRPYITTSAGLTQMRPGDSFSNETNFSMGIGGGAEYQITPRFSLFADVRGYATFISSSQALFCNSGNCKWFVDADLMWQGQLNAGAKLLF